MHVLSPPLRLLPARVAEVSHELFPERVSATPRSRKDVFKLHGSKNFEGFEIYMYSIFSLSVHFWTLSCLYHPRVCRTSPVASLSCDTVAGSFRTGSAQPCSLHNPVYLEMPHVYSKKFLVRASQLSVDSCSCSVLPLDHHLVSREENNGSKLYGSSIVYYCSTRIPLFFFLT